MTSACSVACCGWRCVQGAHRGWLGQLCLQKKASANSHMAASLILSRHCTGTMHFMARLALSDACRTVAGFARLTCCEGFLSGICIVFALKGLHDDGHEQREDDKVADYQPGQHEGCRAPVVCGHQGVHHRVVVFKGQALQKEAWQLDSALQGLSKCKLSGVRHGRHMHTTQGPAHTGGQREMVHDCDKTGGCESFCGIQILVRCMDLGVKLAPSSHRCLHTSDSMTTFRTVAWCGCWSLPPLSALNMATLPLQCH